MLVTLTCASCGKPDLLFRTMLETWAEKEERRTHEQTRLLLSL
jgi:hypothetical protein